MTVAAKGNVKPGPAVNDWKKYLIAALCLIALAALCLTVVSGQHYKTEEARVYSGLDLVMGRTEGKSEGTPHPLMLGALIFGVWGHMHRAVCPGQIPVFDSQFGIFERVRGAFAV